MKLHKGPTNYFHLTLVIIGGLTAASLLYISYLLTLVSFEELGIDTGFSPKPHIALTVNTDRSFYVLGDRVRTSIMINTERKAGGVDIVLAYDPSFLEPLPVAPSALEPLPQKTEAQSKKKPRVAPITYGIVRLPPATYLDMSASKFVAVPYFSIDYERSYIRFSALTEPLKDFIGEGEVASLYFKTLRQGNTELRLLFTKNETADSNVAFGGQDILNKISNASFEIR